MRLGQSAGINPVLATAAATGVYVPGKGDLGPDFLDLEASIHAFRAGELRLQRPILLSDALREVRARCARMLVTAGERGRY